MLLTISKSPILRNADDGHTFYLIDKGLAMKISSSYGDPDSWRMEYDLYASDYATVGHRDFPG
ncbi:nicotinate-nucleotide adenylyltransferase [Paenibacillus alvei A6-6i-x]|nr:nicotinate-nucleotide adenylyltransferase [Paenibacillus alvei A6-6i-x]